jgi:hypothetical protein
VKPGRHKLEQFRECLRLQHTPRLGSPDGAGEDALVHVKLFEPCGALTWFITEWDDDPDHPTGFGLCRIHEDELGANGADGVDLFSTVDQIPDDQIGADLDALVARMGRVAPRPDPRIVLIVDWENGHVRLLSDRTLAGLDLVFSRDPADTGRAEAQVAAERLHEIAHAC